MTGAIGSPEMDRPEARCRECQEHGRVLGHGLGDVFATPKPRGHESEGVSAVKGGTRWTQRLASGPTRLEQNPVGQGAGVEGDPGVESVLAHPDRSPGKADWASAASDPPNLGLEVVKTTGGMQSGQDPLDDPSIGLQGDDRAEGSGGRDVGSHGGKSGFPPVD